MKSVVLAEKPSVGRELARVLGCSNCGNHFENDDYVVTWALGHLVTLCPPDSYGENYRHWRLDNLPMLPERLNTMVIEKTKDQFEIVKGLLNRDDVETVIIATDAGREGELVARWILQQAECNKPIKRLWISSQTDSAIKNGFANLKDGHEYDSLYAAAESRSYADWYIGFNVSRAMSCHFDTRLSAGRVQTPTLALMTSREDEIESFAGRFYWTIKADFGTFQASFYPEENTIRIQNEADANRIFEELKALSKTQEAEVKTVSSVDRTEKPPLAYDLTELQRDANSILGFSAKETLDNLQKLYEVHKIVTYPRTDSRYVTADIVPTLKDRLLALTETPMAMASLSILKNGIRDDLSHFVNDAMVSDHHALLPTEQKVDLSKLNNEEKDLWDLVITRFLQVLSPDYNYKTTTAEIQLGEYKFQTRVSVPVELGWSAIKPVKAKKSTGFEDENSSTKMLKVGDKLKVLNVEMKKNSTLPPPRYTEADLLYAMEHAGKFVDDKDLRERLENGLGTPATRADIIEKLIQNNCIKRRGLELVPTPKGRELVRLVPNQLKSAELTGKWEQRLWKISNGTESEKPFIDDIKNNARELVKQVVANIEKFNPTLMGDSQKKCPYCDWPMVKVLDEYERVQYVCQRFSCGYEEMVAKRAVEEKLSKPVAVVKTDENGKKTILLKKTETKWETVTEIVKESHYRKGRNGTGNGSSVHAGSYSVGNGISRQERENVNSFMRNQNNRSESSTFADFIKASEERKKRDEEKRKKR